MSNDQICKCNNTMDFIHYYEDSYRNEIVYCYCKNCGRLLLEENNKLI